MVTHSLATARGLKILVPGSLHFGLELLPMIPITSRIFVCWFRGEPEGQVFSEFKCQCCPEVRSYLSILPFVSFQVSRFIFTYLFRYDKVMAKQKNSIVISSGRFESPILHCRVDTRACF